MNDRHLFRAKRIDNDELVEGIYALIGKKHVIISKESEGYYTESVEERHGYEIVNVDQSTICQCTGLSDEDGNKIFDGDIVGFIDCTSTENGYSEQYRIGQVAWDKETASFQVTERLSAESYEVLDRGCKVLGNIFDNPELMEEW